MTRSAAGGSGSAAGCERDTTALLRAQGLRPTRARCELLAHLRSTDRHPSAEEITSTLRDEGIGIGVATVYQNLSRLVDVGLVRRLSGTDGRSRYDADMAPHDHAVCDSCGRIVDIDLDPRAKHAVDRATAAEPHVSGWLVTRTTVELRGLCPDCRRH
jgi:Fur family transcriptional regulator, peroxide stress response regulator